MVVPYVTRFLLKLMGQCHKTPVANGKKIFSHKSFNYFVWHLWEVELTYRYIFAFKFTLRSQQPDIVPIICHRKLIHEKNQRQKSCNTVPLKHYFWYVHWWVSKLFEYGLLKSFSIFPSPAGMSLIKLSHGGNNDVIYKLFPLRESLISDIPAGVGNIEQLFLMVCGLRGW
jgi:hypothetical protein